MVLAAEEAQQFNADAEARAVAEFQQYTALVEGFDFQGLIDDTNRKRNYLERAVTPPAKRVRGHSVGQSLLSPGARYILEQARIALSSAAAMHNTEADLSVGGGQTPPGSPESDGARIYSGGQRATGGTPESHGFGSSSAGQGHFSHGSVSPGTFLSAVDTPLANEDSDDGFDLPPHLYSATSPHRDTSSSPAPIRPANVYYDSDPAMFHYSLSPPTFFPHDSEYNHQNQVSSPEYNEHSPGQTPPMTPSSNGSPVSLASPVSNAPPIADHSSSSDASPISQITRSGEAQPARRRIAQVRPARHYPAEPHVSGSSPDSTASRNSQPTQSVEHDLAHSQPQTAQLQSAHYQAVESQSDESQSEIAQSQSAQSQSAQSQSARSQSAEPQSAEPRSAEPQVAQSDPPTPNVVIGSRNAARTLFSAARVPGQSMRLGDAEDDSLQCGSCGYPHRNVSNRCPQLSTVGQMMEMLVATRDMPSTETNQAYAEFLRGMLARKVAMEASQPQN